MKLVTVNCFHPQHADDDEPRLGVTIADSPAEAEQLCRREYAGDGYTRFEAKDSIEGEFAGPARVIGYGGQRPAFSWKP